MDEKNVRRNGLFLELFIVFFTIITIMFILKGSEIPQENNNSESNSSQQASVDESSSDTDRGEPTGFFLYEIKAGDTLWDIAEEYSIDIDMIYELNPGLEDQRCIFPGDKIKLPKWE